MTNKVITISRQFGSGGRSIGKAVAEKLGIPYYDKELVDKVAKESGFSHEFIEEIGEYASVTSSFLFNIFIHSDMAHRAARVRERYGETSKPMEKRLQEKDSKRKVYYKHYTNRNWGEAENYDVCLDSGTLGVDKCVEIVCDIAQMK